MYGDVLARGPRNDRRPRMQGAFHGAMLNTTPYGSLTTIALRSSSKIDGTEPCTVAINPAQLFNDSNASLKSNSKYGSTTLDQSRRQQRHTSFGTYPSIQSPDYNSTTNHLFSSPIPLQLSTANLFCALAWSVSMRERPSLPHLRPREHRPSTPLQTCRGACLSMAR